jgi:hypothetical protein
MELPRVVAFAIVIGELLQIGNFTLAISNALH